MFLSSATPATRTDYVSQYGAGSRAVEDHLKLQTTNDLLFVISAYMAGNSTYHFHPLCLLSVAVNYANRTRFR